MKIRRDFVIALIILFAFPAIGYFVQKRAVDNRMKISATLQPKDSLDVDFSIQYLNEDAEMKNSRLIDLPYTIKVLGTSENSLDEEQIKHILYIINDRDDIAFFNYVPVPDRKGVGRIFEYSYPEESSLVPYGDVLLVDAFNRILQSMDSRDSTFYKSLLEDISYAFPMIDYKIEKQKKE